MKTFRTTSALAAFVVLVLSGAGLAFAQSASFIVSQNGQSVGTASYKFTARASGYDSESLVRVAMQGLNYDLSKTERLNAANKLEHVIASGIVNGSAVNIVAKPDVKPATGSSSAQSSALLLNVSANGRSTTTTLDAHSGAVFLPDFDPGALQTLLALNVTRGGRNIWAVIPKKAGSIEAVTIATDAPEQGTLDGKPIAVQHLTLTIAGEKTEVFAGPENQLLQAELPDPGFALVRTGFVLTPPKNPGAPPPQQQQQYPNQQYPAQQYPGQQYPQQQPQPQQYPAQQQPQQYPAPQQYPQQPQQYPQPQQ